ncbi:MAG: hypothetical protein A3J75_06725 [Acidobacteria bacterium RBG_16_68_9]|nr:MAG: hypothetical protein A3J75_06725 [Acidobacteria bacterium RBG_16_68_9]
MPLPDDRDTFEAAFRAAVAAVLPSATVEVVARTIVAIKLRVDLDEDRFMDVFFNERNRRTDLVLIERGRRVFGYDNLGDWHCHPLAVPDRHEACAEPTLEDFVRAAVTGSRRT